MSRLTVNPAVVLRERLAAVGAERARAADKPGTNLVSDLLVQIGGNWSEFNVPDLLWHVQASLNLYGWGKSRQGTSDRLTAVVTQFAQEWQAETLSSNLFAQELRQHLLSVQGGKDVTVRDKAILQTLVEDVTANPDRSPERMERDLRSTLSSYLSDAWDDDSVWEDVRFAEQALDGFIIRWNSN